MRAPLSWMQDFTPLDADPREIAAALDQLGFEVEAIDEPGREIQGVRVAKIVDIVAHPDADRLQLAEVDFGSGTTQVVCGAPNIAVGMVVPFASAGASLPGGFQLERRKIRGVYSDGMLCSGRELGLTEDHGGIMALDADTELGIDLRSALGLDDVIFDLSITANRPDAMSIVGLARELAAHFKLAFVLPEPPVSPARPADGGLGGVEIVVEAAERCDRFVGRVASVTMGPSPAWVVRRLTLAGMRSISNVVDVTNYVMLERCRPLHAFDLGKLAGRGLIVRMAQDGETIATLDGVVRTLTAEDLLICDGERRPQAIAGIMGAADAEVSASTTEILLESASFDAAGISKSSKRLGLRSEASSRFERGVDPDGCVSGAERAMELLVSVAGAIATPGHVDVYPVPRERERITVRTARIGAILGLQATTDEVLGALEPLGIECVVGAAGTEIEAVVPTSRPDLVREIDLIEEVARRIGLDRLPRTLPDTSHHPGFLTSRQRERRLIADVLVGLGYCEAHTLSLLSPEDLDKVGLSTEHVVEAANPLRAEESVLRPSLRPGLLRAAADNAGYGITSLNLFEMGTVFHPPVGGALLPIERERLAWMRVGMVTRTPVESSRFVDVYDAMDTVRALIAALGLADAEFQAAPSRAAVPGFHPTRTVEVLVDGEVVGAVGELDPTTLRRYHLDGPVVLAEIDLGDLLEGRRQDRTFVAPSRYPGSSVDLAFVLDEAVAADAVVTTLRLAVPDLVESVRCFDEFRSDALGPGRRSLAFALRFRAPDRTLTDAEVAEARGRCIEAVGERHGGLLRA